MSRKYYFDISVSAKVKTTIEADSLEEAQDVFKHLDWKVKLDAIGPYDKITAFDQSEFDEPQIVFTGSETKDGEPIWYCNNFCEIVGDNILYTWYNQGPSLLVSKYGIVQNQTVDGETVEQSICDNTQNALNKDMITPYCKHCHRKAKRAIY